MELQRLQFDGMTSVKSLATNNTSFKNKENVSKLTNETAAGPIPEKWLTQAYLTNW